MGEPILALRGDSICRGIMPTILFNPGKVLLIL
jgi:hypothetical protein